MKKIFYSKIWKGFEAPEQPEFYTLGGVNEYNQVYAEAKRNALPVLNPELVNEDTFDYDTYKIINDIADPQDYDWPGSWHIQGLNQEGKIFEGDGVCASEGIVLSLPNQPVKITPEQAAKVEEGMDLWRGKDKPVKPESPKEGEEKIMNYQDLDKMAIAYLEMQYDPGYVRARLAENNYAPNWKLIIQSFKAGVYTIVGKQKQEIQSLRDQLAAKEKGYKRALDHLTDENTKLEEENRKLKETGTEMTAYKDKKFMSTENKSESTKEGEEKNSDRYIPQTEASKGYTESSLRAKLREANKEIQSLRDQLVQEDHKAVFIKSLQDQLAAKEAEIARYIAANSILCDSESEVKLANENNRLEIENRKLRGVLKELIPLAEDGYKLHKKNGCHQEFLSEDIERLDRAKELLNQ